ncbi:MAG: VOC family protein [Rubricoccaceae bacterium]|nr:VOC family protein [Rubricoccaceae bacterium]
MARITHFEIHADDPDALARFYTDALGWSIHRWDGPWEYWLITTGPDDEPGINGAIVRRRGPEPAAGQPVNAFVCTAQVDDLDATVEAALAAGATIGVEKMAVPGVGYLAYLHDPQGNIVGVMQSDPAAA